MAALGAAGSELKREGNLGGWVNGVWGTLA